MFKVLIVDDDALIRQYFISFLNWEQYGYEIIGEASNGENALEFISNNHVDLVLTDISMPVMDGVELIKNVKSQNSDIEFLVLSNFDEFKLVKDAMKYGAYDYLLKFEIDAVNLTSVLTAIKNELNNRGVNGNKAAKGLFEDKWKVQLIQQYWKSILLGQSDGEKINSEALSLGMEIKNGSYVLLLADIDTPKGENLFPDNQSNELNESLSTIVSELSELCKYSFTIKIYEKRWAVILRFRENGNGFIKNASFEIAKKLIKAVKQNFGVVMTIAISEVIYSMSEFPTYYKKVEVCIQSKFYWNIGKVVDTSFFNGFKTEFNNKLMYDLQKQIVNSLKSSEFEGACVYADTLFKEIDSQKYAPDVIYEYFTGIVLFMKNLLEEKGIILQKSNEITFLASKEIKSFATLEEVKIWFIGFIEQVSKFLTENSPVSDRREIRKAIALIRENYDKNITLEYVAEYVGMSRNYFCTIFKCETGMSFIEYMNKVRIDKAKILITNSDKSMKEVAAEVGMNYGYFCKVFKEYMGERPSRLRYK